jgi:hypothetical protein
MSATATAIREVMRLLGTRFTGTDEELLRTDHAGVVQARAIVDAVRKADQTDRPCLAEVASRGALGMNAIVHPRRLSNRRRP